jgi:hypothetical protein
MTFSTRSKKRTLMSFFLLVFICMPITIYAQSEECVSLYKRFTDNHTKKPLVAYESAKEYLRKCSNDDQYGVYIKKWTAAYEKIARDNEARLNTPVQSNPSTPARILEQSEAQLPQEKIPLAAITLW